MALKLQQLRVAIGITAKGEAKVLYCGPDAAKADAALAEAGPEFELAGAYPKGVFPLMPRYPAREAEQAKERALEAQRRAEAEAAATKLAVQEKRDRASRLRAEALALEKTLPKEPNSR